MSKKKTRKSKAISRRTFPPVAPPPAAYGQQDDEGKMDFGGLPARDLKKNLGCG